MDATTMPQVVKPSILRILETMTRVNMTWNVAVMDKMTRHSVVDTLVLEPGRFEATSDRIGVESLWGGAGAILGQPNPSARIGVKSLLRGAGSILRQPNLSARIGVQSLLRSA